MKLGKKDFALIFHEDNSTSVYLPKGLPDDYASEACGALIVAVTAVHDEKIREMCLKKAKGIKKESKK